MLSGLLNSWATSDVRVTMRYVRSVEETKRVAVEAIKLSSRKGVHKLATNENSRQCRRLQVIETNWWSRGGSNP